LGTPHSTRWIRAIEAILHHPSTLKLDLTAPDASSVADFIIARIEPDPDTRSSIVALAADIHELSSRFADIADIKHPRVRLTRIEDEACALFHADTLRFRLLCTYAGPGMQWLKNDNVRRHELGSRGRTLVEATNAIVINQAAIQTVPETHVAIFKGRLFEDEEDNALVHRSSPLAHPTDYRLRLCVDFASCGC